MGGAPHNLAIIRRLFDVDLKRLPTARHHLVNEAAAVRRQLLAFMDSRL